MHTTPASLLERLRSPSSGAWTEFVALYTPLLYHWAGRLGFKGEDAKDLLQEVFLLLVRDLPGFRYDPTKGRFRAWLSRVFRNQALSRKRRPALAGHALSQESLDDLCADDNVSAWQEEEYCEYVVASALREMRCAFHDTTWQACWAVVVEGRPAAEVAAELDMSVNAVYVARSRVLRHLRERLAGLLD
jgi:RNA polymerase sigma-70 factor (ECF subfamily)